MPDYLKGVVKTIEPEVSEKGFHRKFEANGKEYFCFNIVWEGDIKPGSMSGLAAISRFKPGEAVNYTVKEKKNGGLQYSLSKVESKDGGSGGNKYTYNDPTLIKKAAMIGAFECTIELLHQMSITPMKEGHEDRKVILARGQQIYEWIIKDVTDTRDDMFNRKFAILNAIKALAIMPEAKKSKTIIADCIAFAEEQLTMVKACGDAKS